MTIDPLWAILAPVAVALILAIGRAIRWLTYRGARMTAGLVVDNIGDSLEERWEASISGKVDPVWEAVQEIRDELRYNGGRSLKDQIRRIEQTLETVANEQRRG